MRRILLANPPVTSITLCARGSNRGGAAESSEGDGGWRVLISSDVRLKYSRRSRWMTVDGRCHGMTWSMRNSRGVRWIAVVTSACHVVEGRG